MDKLGRVTKGGSPRITSNSDRDYYQKPLAEEQQGNLNETHEYKQKNYEQEPDYFKEQLFNDLAFKHDRFIPVQGKIAEAYQALKATPASTLSQPANEPSACNQTFLPTSVLEEKVTVGFSLTQKGELVDHLFEEALSMLGNLEVPNKPSLFLVYAHNNPSHGKAAADTAKYLIDKLSKIQIKLYSDQTPMGPMYSSSPGELKADGKLEDILTSQLCLLPTQLRGDVEPVNKVVVCCSEVLSSYLRWPHYQSFYQQLQKAYHTDKAQKDTSAIRVVVKKFSQEPPYRAEFHHVLTEIAFLQIRAAELGDQHGIIPVSLSPKSYEYCLARFIPTTTVRMEDIVRFEGQAQAGQEVYPNQSRHWVLFKLIERLLVSNDEAGTFLNQFWQGYSDFISQLKHSPCAPSPLEFAKLINGIFGGIRTALYSRLAVTVQQQQSLLPDLAKRLEHLNTVLQEKQEAQLQALKQERQPLATLGNDIGRFTAQFKANLKNSGDLDLLETMYVSLEGRDKNQEDEPTFPLEDAFEKAFQSEAKVILLKGVAGSGKSTFNRHLALKKLEGHINEADPQKKPPLVFFIALRNIKDPHKNAIQEFLKEEKFTDNDIDLLRSKYKCIFIFDGYDEIKDRNKDFYNLNKLWEWKNAKFVITSRPEYLNPGYQQYFCAPNLSIAEQKTFLQEFWIAPFSEQTQKIYIQKYIEKQNLGWSVDQYENEFKKLSGLEAELKRPIVLRLILEVMPTLVESGIKNLTLSSIYEAYLQKWWGNWQKRLANIQLTIAQETALEDLCEGDGFTEKGFEFSQDCALALTKTKLITAEKNKIFEDEYNAVYSVFFKKDPTKQLLLANAPLICTLSGHYQFPHKSMQEYCVARAIFKSGAQAEEGFKYLVPRHDRALNQLNLVNEPVILDFLADSVEQSTAFEKHLRNWLQASKEDEKVSQGAANAATILVRGGVQFHDEDFQRVRIPGANLMQGVWDGADFSGADLSYVRFDRAWLRNVKFDRARLTGVEFGELPALNFQGITFKCRYSPDGYWLAVIQECAIELYEVQTLTHTVTLRSHIEYFSAHLKDISDIEFSYFKYIEFSPDGKYLLAGKHIYAGWNGTVEIKNSFDVITIWANGLNGFTLFKTFTADFGMVTNVTFSPKGNQFAIGNYEGSIQLWEINENNIAPSLVKTFQEQSNEINSISFSSDGALLASGSKGQSGNIKIWSTTGENTAPLTEIGGHKEEVASVTFSSSGSDILLASAGRYMDETVKLWLFKNNHLHLLKTFEGGSNIVQFSAKNDWIASASNDSTIKLWPVKGESLTSIREFRNYWGRIENLVFSRDGTQILSSSEDGMVKLWSITSLQEISARQRHGHASNVTHLTFLSNGQFLSGCENGVIKLWSIEGNKAVFLKNFKVHERIYALTSLPNGSSLMGTGIVEGVIKFSTKIWSIAGENVIPIATLQSTPGRGIRSMAFSHHGKYLALSVDDLKLFSIDESNVIRLKYFEFAEIISLTFSPDNTLLASGGSLATFNTYLIKLWEVEGSKTTPVKIFRGHASQIYSLAFSPDQSLLASGDQAIDATNSNIKIWSVKGQKDALMTLSGHLGTVVCLAFSTDGKLLASGSTDGAVKIWSVDSGECLVSIHAHAINVSSVAWYETQDDLYLLTGGGDNIVRLWQVLRGQTYWATLCWTSQQDRLTLDGASVEGAEGLTPLNQKLLQQKGGVGKPALSHPSTIARSTAPAYA